MSNNQTLTLTINGQYKNIATPNNILQNILINLGFDPQYLVIDLNGKLIKNTDFDKTTLKNNDKIEIIQFMGGG